jgi:hypothetical protein
MRCHIGYGWEDKSFDFNDPRNIDCLVCHDKTDTYKKIKGGAGWPATAENATISKGGPILFLQRILTGAAQLRAQGYGSPASDDALKVFGFLQSQYEYSFENQSKNRLKRHSDWKQTWHSTICLLFTDPRKPFKWLLLSETWGWYLWEGMKLHDCHISLVS